MHIGEVLHIRKHGEKMMEQLTSGLVQHFFQCSLRIGRPSLFLHDILVQVHGLLFLFFWKKIG